ncbi:hypothetical protein RchiOBHm_Chr5g0004111 [Rosa chinensis]|uniref:Uncharacterized protein n=1 Tax=Rosa chinensis TaxID=74649 RepID=A0A2P6Q321_ROSCH|nr:hypothetical protein RchiOBHm_Chr5g0004111 [Rosa chinensis]
MASQLFQSASDQHKFQTTVEHQNSRTPSYISLERNQVPPFCY